MRKVPEKTHRNPENHPFVPVANNNYNGASPENSGNIDQAFDDDGYFDSFPIGYRFLPTDEELICAYLLPKINHGRLPRHRFHNANVYESSPEKLARRYPSQGGKHWYFFSRRKRKYLRGHRPDRAARNEGNEKLGYWKATGSKKPVTVNGEEVGAKQVLVYYKGKNPYGIKQPWIMHEYKATKSIPADGKEMKLDECILCKIYRNSWNTNDKAKARAKDQAQAEQVVNGNKVPEKTDSPESVTSRLLETNNAYDNHFIEKETPVRFTTSSSFAYNTVCTSRDHESMGIQHPRTSSYYPYNLNPNTMSCSSAYDIVCKRQECEKMGLQYPIYANFSVPMMDPFADSYVPDCPNPNTMPSSPSHLGTSPEYEDMTNPSTSSYVPPYRGMTQIPYSLYDDDLYDYSALYTMGLVQTPLIIREPGPLMTTEEGGSDGLNASFLDTLPRDCEVATSSRNDENGNQFQQQPEDDLYQPWQPPRN